MRTLAERRGNGRYLYWSVTTAALKVLLVGYMLYRLIHCEV